MPFFKANITQILAASLLSVTLSLPALAQQTGNETDDTMATSGLKIAQLEQYNDKQGVTDTEIHIGSCISLTGPLQERGKQITAGANCYFNYINEKGGVNGRQIKLNSCDDAYDPE